MANYTQVPHRTAADRKSESALHLSLWRRVAMVLLWKLLELLFAIDAWQRRCALRRTGPISETRNLRPKKKSS